MRYSILNATTQQVQAVGGLDIKELKSTQMVFAELTDAQVAQLRAQGCAVSAVGKVSVGVIATPVITPPIPVAAIPTYTPSELVKIIGGDKLRGFSDPPLYGEGMNLAIIGTGIRETHELINGRIVWRKNYTSDVMTDGFDHDSGTCSIALAAAPKCNILNMKVINSKGEGTEEEVVMAIDDCISLIDDEPEFAPNVINLSLGGVDDGNPNSAMRVACRAAIKAGILVLAACGNGGPMPGTITSPACERYVCAVGSVKYLADRRTFVVSDFSSRGPTRENLTKPDAVMFGEDVIMASSASDTATVAKSGTSFASPLGCGLAILYLEGVNIKAQAKVLLGDMPPAQFYYVPPDIMIDQYFKRISIKPAGVAASKEDVYGWGLVYGPLVLQALQPGAGVGISSILSSILPVMMILPMIGMMAKMGKANTKPAKTKVEEHSR